MIPHAFSEKPVLKLMFASLIRASQTWQRINITAFELKQLEELQTRLQAEFDQRTKSSNQPASLQRFSSKKQT